MPENKNNASDWEALAEAIATTLTDGHLDPCGRCGHKRKRHGEWWGAPEDGCSWNDAHGECDCIHFVEPTEAAK